MNLPKKITPYPIIDAINELNSFADLKENWDSYGASIISKDIIQQAIHFVKELNKKNIEVYYTAPSPQGDILLEIRNNDKTVEIEFLSDNKKSIISYFKNEVVESSELNTESEKKILEWFLN